MDLCEFTEAEIWREIEWLRSMREPGEVGVYDNRVTMSDLAIASLQGRRNFITAFLGTSRGSSKSAS